MRCASMATVLKETAMEFVRRQGKGSGAPDDPDVFSVLKFKMNQNEGYALAYREIDHERILSEVDSVQILYIK